MKFRYIVSAVMLGSLVTAAAETAQPVKQQSRRGAAPQTEQRAGSVSDSQTISGEVIGIRHLKGPGNNSGQARSVIRLELRDGGTAIVDVGSRQTIQQLNLEEGQVVKVTGKRSTVGGREVFRADRVSSNGRTVAVQRQQTVGSEEGTIVAGTIRGFRQLDLRNRKGQQETHTLVSVQLENGGSTIVDLGPRDRLRDLKLKKGERVKLLVQDGSIDGRKVLLANRMAFPDRRQKAGQGTTKASGQEFTVRGTVRGYQVLSLGSGSDKQVLLNLKLEDGRSVLIDAGSYQPGELKLSELDVEDQVTIKARRVEKGGRQMLVAESIHFENMQGGSADSYESETTPRKQKEKRSK